MLTVVVCSAGVTAAVANAWSETTTVTPCSDPRASFASPPRRSIDAAAALAGAPRHMPPPTEMALSIQDYETIDELGSGVYGIVYRARHRQTGQIVAVKRVQRSRLSSDKLVSNLRNEISIMQHIKHPNIVELYGIFVRADRVDWRCGGEEAHMLMRACLTGNQERYLHGHGALRGGRDPDADAPQEALPGGPRAVLYVPARYGLDARVLLLLAV